QSLPAIASPKFTEPLLDTPQTITVVPRAVIEAQVAETLRDVLRNVPGITMQAGEGGALPGDNLTMRGFSASNDIFVDGVRDVGPYARDAFNLEQVEVIKGPSSSFGGRGSTGGAINLESKSPGLEAQKSGSFGFGNAESRRGTFDVNTPLAALGASTAGRLNLMWQDAGVPGRDVVENRSWALAPSIGFGITTPTRVTLSYQHLKQNNVPDYGLPWGASTDAATGIDFPSGALNAVPAVAQSNFYGLENYDFEHVRNDMGTLRIDHDFKRTGFTLRVTSRYGDTLRDHAITAPRPPNRQLQRRWMHNETLVNQVGVTGSKKTGMLTHDLSFGLEAGTEGTATRNSAQTANQPGISLVQAPDPSQLPFGPMPEITGNPSKGNTGTFGAYLFDTVNLSRKVQVSGGARWDRSDVSYKLTTLATGDVAQLERVDRMTSWRAGVVYKPTVEGSIYASAGTSFNPVSDAGAAGAALSAAENSVNNVNLEPEKSRNLEVGAKWATFQNRLALTGAIFRTDKTNARTRNLASEAYVLAGKQRVQGVEIGASGRIGEHIQTLASYSFLGSDIRDSANATEEGRDLALTPKRTGSLWASWDLRRGVSIGGGAQFMDAVFRNTTSDLSVPSYWLVNAMASYAVNSHLTLRFNGNNLSDKAYVDRVGGGHYIPGPRRSGQLTASVGF
ncbi:MAG: TonB-dependent siderophore receptor, partial [Acidobacteriota bacterium]